MMPYGMGGWGFGGIGMLAGAIFWIAILVLIVWVVTRLVSSQAPAHHTPSLPAAPSALEVIKVRYAKGEITKAEFDQMKQDLS